MELLPFEPAPVAPASGLPSLRRRLAEARNRVELLSTDQARAGAMLGALNLPMDGLLDQVAATGGLVVDWGWLRLLGCGNVRMMGSISSWNGLGPSPCFPGIPGALVVGHDVRGGLFAINQGGLPGMPGQVHYLVPDSFEWRDLCMSYAGLVEWVLQGNLDRFYGPVRWSGWQRDVLTLSGDQGLRAMPRPHQVGRTRPAGPPEAPRIQVVPMTELFAVLQRNAQGHAAR